MHCPVISLGRIMTNLWTAFNLVVMKSSRPKTALALRPCPWLTLAQNLLKRFCELWRESRALSHLVMSAWKLTQVVPPFSKRILTRSWPTSLPTLSLVYVWSVFHFFWTLLSSLISRRELLRFILLAKLPKQRKSSSKLPSLSWRRTLTLYATYVFLSIELIEIPRIGNKLREWGKTLADVTPSVVDYESSRSNRYSRLWIIPWDFVIRLLLPQPLAKATFNDWKSIFNKPRTRTDWNTTAS